MGFMAPFGLGVVRSRFTKIGPMESAGPVPPYESRSFKQESLQLMSHFDFPEFPFTGVSVVDSDPSKHSLI